MLRLRRLGPMDRLLRNSRCRYRLRLLRTNLNFILHSTSGISPLLQFPINSPSYQTRRILTFRSVWIFFSGSVILFNKWVLDTAGFRTYSPTYPSIAVPNVVQRLPNLPDDMASRLRHDNDSNPRPNNKPSRRPKDRENGRKNISTRHRPHRRLLLSFTHLLQSSISLPLCSIHSNAQGTSLTQALRPLPFNTLAYLFGFRRVCPLASSLLRGQ
jgi:hypothetical protein